MKWRRGSSNVGTSTTFVAPQDAAGFSVTSSGKNLCAYYPFWTEAFLFTNIIVFLGTEVIFKGEPTAFKSDLCWPLILRHRVINSRSARFGIEMLFLYVTSTLLCNILFMKWTNSDDSILFGRGISTKWSQKWLSGILPTGTRSNKIPWSPSWREWMTHE